MFESKESDGIYVLYQHVFVYSTYNLPGIQPIDMHYELTNFCDKRLKEMMGMRHFLSWHFLSTAQVDSNIFGWNPQRTYEIWPDSRGCKLIP